MNEEYIQLLSKTATNSSRRERHQGSEVGKEALDCIQKGWLTSKYSIGRWRSNSDEILVDRLVGLST